MHNGLDSSNHSATFPLLLGLFTTGGAVLGLEIAAYSQFSFLHGYVLKYQGLLISVLMAGVAAGAFLSDWKKLKTTLFPVYLAEFGIILLAIQTYFAPILFISLPGSVLPAVYFGINLLLGLFAGFEFVLICNVIRSFNSSGSKPGFLYSIIVLGAVIIALIFIKIIKNLFASI